MRLRETTALEWRLLAEALPLVARVRFDLKRYPFHRIETAYARRSGRSSRTDGDADADLGLATAIGQAVQRASRLVPGATCLPRALATRVMLERRGIHNTLCFGVARSVSGPIEAHAWIEVAAVVVVGHLPDLDRYHRMPELPDPLR